MKILLLYLGLFLLPATRLFAQSRLSVAPTSWFTYGHYTYLLYSLTNNSTTPLAGHDLSSSGGLTLRYRINPTWDLSAGILYTKNASHLKTPLNDDIQLTSETIQLPILLNYRVSEHRLSPYFSAGILLEKSKTFSDVPLKTNALIGLGLEYRLNAVFSLLVQPTASYFLSKQAPNPLGDYNHYTSYTVGLQTQLSWHF